MEICKVGLWMESIDPGLPLTFLESHIRRGNALIGTSYELMGDRVPDAAWVALEGDDRKIARALKRRNKEGHHGPATATLRPPRRHHSLARGDQCRRTGTGHGRRFLGGTRSVSGTRS